MFLCFFLSSWLFLILLCYVVAIQACLIFCNVLLTLVPGLLPTHDVFSVVQNAFTQLMIVSFLMSTNTILESCHWKRCPVVETVNLNRKASSTSITEQEKKLQLLKCPLSYGTRHWYDRVQTSCWLLLPLNHSFSRTIRVARACIQYKTLYINYLKWGHHLYLWCIF